jgi:TonB family protein
MLPQSQFDSPMLASAQAPVAIAALTQDRALIGLLRSTIDPTSDLILVTSEAELAPHLNSRRVSACLLDSMFIEGDLGAMAERLRDTWSDLVLVVVGTAEEQSKVASQITSGVVYRFLHRPVSAPRVRLFVEAALRRHEVENVERTLEYAVPDFSKLDAAKTEAPRGKGRGGLLGGIAVVALLAAAGGWYVLSGRGTAPASPEVAQVVSEPPSAETPAPEPVTAPAARIPEPEPEPATPPVTPAAAPAAAPAQAAPTESVAERLRQAESAPQPAPVVNLPEESTPPAAPPALTHKQRLDNQLAQAEAALQRGELASPPGRNAVELFRGALDLDPSSTLAKAGLVRVSDRLLSAAERALTAGNPEDAKTMVAVAETLTPASSRGAFLMMQIEMEHERAALARAQDSTETSKQERAATYRRLAATRLRSGALIEPPEDNARFYLEAARRIAPEDPELPDVTRSLQKELLARASTAAAAGNAADTERWLANADGAGAARPEMAGIRRALQDTLIGARADKVGTLAQSFTTALGGNLLLQPATGSAKFYLLELIRTDSGSPAVASARQSLGAAYLRQMRAALVRNDLRDADAWLNEARTIGFASDDLNTAEAELTTARDKLAHPTSVVGANSLERLEYVPPKFPAAARNRGLTGWVEVEFTVMTDGSTADITVTNSNPRRTFDSAATAAIREWRFKPVKGADGKPIEQRASVRIRFSDE